MISGGFPKTLPSGNCNWNKPQATTICLILSMAVSISKKKNLEFWDVLSRFCPNFKPFWKEPTCFKAVAHVRSFAPEATVDGLHPGAFGLKKRLGAWEVARCAEIWNPYYVCINEEQVSTQLKILVKMGNLPRRGVNMEKILKPPPSYLMSSGLHSLNVGCSNSWSFFFGISILGLPGATFLRVSLASSVEPLSFFFWHYEGRHCHLLWCMNMPSVM